MATGTSAAVASTKPTTLWSLESNGANRIATVTNPNSHPQNQTQHASTSGGTNAPSSSVWRPEGRHAQHASYSSTSNPGLFLSTGTTASIPTSPDGASSHQPNSPSSPSPLRGELHIHVPTFTNPDPSRNPHPSYPPNDNASTFTLASSTFPHHYSNAGGGGGAGGGGTMTAPPSTYTRSIRTRGDVDAAAGRADEDASVRALPPSRRESGESVRSKWSAAFTGGGGSLSGKVGSPLGSGNGNGGGGGRGGGGEESEADEVKRRVLERELSASNTGLSVDAGVDVDDAKPAEGKGKGKEKARDEDHVDQPPNPTPILPGGLVSPNVVQPATTPTTSTSAVPTSAPAPAPESESNELSRTRSGSVTPPASIRDPESASTFGMAEQKKSVKGKEREKSLYSIDTFETGTGEGTGGYWTPREESPELRI
ncbi:hypothetical protein BT69DRAFT_1286877 [Atractiella rhizophila]|nr:hypothetical protein BT69DRAFT_1286877 [Atractiella rhizophila]